MVDVGHAHEGPIRMSYFRGNFERCYFVFFLTMTHYATVSKRLTRRYLFQMT